jgi:hypothetical protein
MTTVLETPQDVMALLDEFTRRVRADNVMGDPLLCLLSSEIMEDTGLTVDELPDLDIPHRVWASEWGEVIIQSQQPDGTYIRPRTIDDQWTMVRERPGYSDNHPYQNGEA